MVLVHDEQHVLSEDEALVSCSLFTVHATGLQVRFFHVEYDCTLMPLLPCPSLVFHVVCGFAKFPLTGIS